MTHLCILRMSEVSNHFRVLHMVYSNFVRCCDLCVRRIHTHHRASSQTNNGWQKQNGHRRRITNFYYYSHYMFDCYCCCLIFGLTIRAFTYRKERSLDNNINFWSVTVVVVDTFFTYFFFFLVGWLKLSIALRVSHSYNLTIKFGVLLFCFVCSRVLSYRKKTTCLQTMDDGGWLPHCHICQMLILTGAGNWSMCITNSYYDRLIYNRWWIQTFYVHKLCVYVQSHDEYWKTGKLHTLASECGWKQNTVAEIQCIQPIMCLLVDHQWSRDRDIIM